MPDDDTTVQGDVGFTGLKSRLSPIALPEGYVQASENMRMDRNVAQTRRGAKRIADNVTVTSVPLTLPFTLGVDVAVSGITRSGGTATATTGAAHGYTTGDTVNIRGAAQSEYNIDAIVASTPTTTTFTYAVTGTPATPATGTIVANKGPVILSSYTGGIFTAGVYSSPRVDNAAEYIVLVSSDRAFLWRNGAGLITKTFPTSPVNDFVLPGDEVEVLQAFDRCYIFRYRSETELAVTGITQSGGTATVTTGSAHGYTTGEVVKVTGADQAGYNAEFAVASTPTTTTFTVVVPSGTVSPATTTAPARLACRRVCAPLYWDGATGTNFVRAAVGTHPTGPTYSRLQSSAVVTYFNNQIVEVTGRDVIQVTDVLDPDTSDPVLKSFRTNSGSNDYAVAVHNYQDRRLLVFMRKSIYQATIAITADGTSIDPTASSVALMTNEIGCCARRSVVTAGQNIFFLSDAGVYRLDAQLDLQLLGNSRPLSDDIADVMATINVQAVGQSNAIYFNNRYWLAVPTTLANGDASARPNTLLVFNTLNDAWESVDRYSFTLDRLVVSDYGTQRRLFAASRAGKMFLLDEMENGRDDQNTGSGYDVVPGRLVTRRYGFGTLTQKRILRAVGTVVMPAGGVITMKVNTVDPDAKMTCATVTSAVDDDYTLRGAIRRRAVFAELEFLTGDGRPVIRACNVQASIAQLPFGSRTID